MSFSSSNETSRQAVREGYPVAADVKLDRPGEGRDCIFCELVLPIKEIEAKVRRACSNAAAARDNDTREAPRWHLSSIRPSA